MAPKQQRITAFFSKSLPPVRAGRTARGASAAVLGRHMSSTARLRPAPRHLATPHPPHKPKARETPSGPLHTVCATVPPPSPSPLHERAIPEPLPRLPRSHPFLRLLAGGVLQTGKTGARAARPSACCRLRTPDKDAGASESRHAKHATEQEKPASRESRRTTVRLCVSEEGAARCTVHVDDAPGEQGLGRCAGRLVLDISAQGNRDMLLATDTGPVMPPTHLLAPPKGPPGQEEVLEKYGEWTPIEPLAADTDWMVEDSILRGYCMASSFRRRVPATPTVRSRHAPCGAKDSPSTFNGHFGEQLSRRTSTSAAPHTSSFTPSQTSRTRLPRTSSEASASARGRLRTCTARVRC